MQNKANFRNDKMNLSLDMTSNYKILSRWRGQKTKPIQTQFKANLSQNKPNLTQYKANSKPISKHVLSGVEWANCRKGKNERFCMDKEL